MVCQHNPHPDLANQIGAGDEKDDPVNRVCPEREGPPHSGHDTITDLDTLRVISSSSDSSHSEKSEKRGRKATIIDWLQRQIVSSKNRYACQMGFAYMVAALFVIVKPISSVFPNPFWIGVSVVTVLDNTVGGFLGLSLQRMIGTVIGGGASIVIMTITRAIFPLWNWHAVLVLSILMFCQVFCITRIKLLPNMSYAGNIGLLTTVILLLAGYQDLTQDRLYRCAELGAWRVLNLLIGIFIAMLSSLCLFPLKANRTMRANLGKALNEAAELFERTVDRHPYRQDKSTAPISEPLSTWTNTTTRVSLARALSRTFSTVRPEHAAPAPFNTRQPLEDLCSLYDGSTSNKVFAVLRLLETESTRLRNVSNEFYLQIPFRVCIGGRGRRDRMRRDMRRARRYNDAIEAMKRIVWPLASFRLLLPLTRLSSDPVRASLLPTPATLASFHASTDVMRRIATILKDIRRPVSDYADEWLTLERIVSQCHLEIQHELLHVVHVDMRAQHELHIETNSAQLLFHYGFLVRCSMIWDGLKTVIAKLSPHREGAQSTGTSGTVTPTL